MKLVANVGSERIATLVVDRVPNHGRIDLATATVSLPAFAAVADALWRAQDAKIIVPTTCDAVALLGADADRGWRNTLTARWHAGQLARWLHSRCNVREAHNSLPQGFWVVCDEAGAVIAAAMGATGMSTDGIGLAVGNPMAIVQAAESALELQLLADWFDRQWNLIAQSPDAHNRLPVVCESVSVHRAPATIYGRMLHAVFGDRGEALDEDGVVKAATGIRTTAVWRKLYRFQRDGVVGAIDKLNRFGGCIIADSVGLGKTFEALAVIKYHELRNDRVLVLCPKRLRDNWTLYRSNDRRNPLCGDRFNYDVLNHTDLSRDDGHSGDIDLSHVNWGNYDLVVIDESHNFRNKKTPRQGQETRYDRLMRRIVQEGVKTRVLMLSATPVNNRLADLRNQIAFATEGRDDALCEVGIASIDKTTRAAQKQFNQWLDLGEPERTPGRLIEMLGFDYFSLLDHLTIARSRRHIEKYYGTAETGQFPERLRPINLRPDVDAAGQFRPIRELNREIRKLTLAAYAPLRYLLPGRKDAYDRKYSTQVRGGAGSFRQVDREESLVALLRVNVLKRLESAVTSFALTVERQLADVDQMLARLADRTAEVEELDLDELNLDDPALEALVVGRKVKVLLQDVDVVRWRQDLLEDRNRLATLVDSARAVTPERDVKLATLRQMIAAKVAAPINAHNRKVIVFTAFAETATYLYEQVAPWAKASLGVESALVTGSGANKTTLPDLHRDLGSVLSAFAPRAKERPADLASEGELDLLIATDCISEGQNLQDCDWLINYDIHWNPVRIIQRFGRIDRIGSPNQRIQLVNFWPNMQLEEYIGLEQRVSGRMVLLDVSATGEENLIERQSGDPMNDLEYRRRQLVKLQDAVIDLEDLSSGLAITDLTLSDFRIDLSRARKAIPGLEDLPLTSYAVTASRDDDVPAGTIFCLRADEPVAARIAEAAYPLGCTFLVHVGQDGVVVLPYSQAKAILDRLRRLCLGRELPDTAACARFDKATHDGRDMQCYQRQLAAAVASLVGKGEERAVATLFSAAGSHGTKGASAGVGDFEVVAMLVVLPTVAGGQQG